MKSLRRLAVAAVIFLLALGCGSWVTAEEPEVTLWVVTERTQETGMNKVVQEAMEEFSWKHPNVSFNLEILPVGDQDRARRMFCFCLRKPLQARARGARESSR